MVNTPVVKPERASMSIPGSYDPTLPLGSSQRGDNWQLPKNASACALRRFHTGGSNVSPPSRFAIRSETILPILKAAVAAGKDALLPWIALSDSVIKKSSTINPEVNTACARTPEGAGTKCFASISGTRR